MVDSRYIMPSYFQASPESPYHLSVGAVLVNDKGELACHYFTDAPIVGGRVCILMRETVEEKESLEQALARGLMEEFGATGKISAYLGSKVTHFESRGVEVQKTTIYFKVQLDSFDEKLRLKDDPESSSQILWLKPAEVIEKMQEIYQERGVDDINESDILLKLKKNVMS